MCAHIQQINDSMEMSEGQVTHRFDYIEDYLNRFVRHRMFLKSRYLMFIRLRTVE